MSSTGALVNGGKSYKPPYSGHKAMQVDKAKGMGSSQFVGKKKVTEGRKANLVSGGKKGS